MDIEKLGWGEYGLAGLVILALFVLLFFVLKESKKSYEQLSRESNENYAKLNQATIDHIDRLQADHAEERRIAHESRKESDARIERALQEITRAINKQ